MEEALRTACLKFNMKEVKRLLEEGTTITGELLLSLTAYRSGCEEVVMYLIEEASMRGTLDSIIHVNYNGRTPLYYLIDICEISGVNKPRFDLIKLLLEKGANPNDTEYVLGQSCLRNAVLAGNLELVKLLLEYGARLGEDDGGYSELDLAGINGHTEIVKLLLPYINIEYTEYDTKLIYAVWTGNLPIVKTLLMYGVKLLGESSDLTSEERSEMFMNGHDFSKTPWASLLTHAACHNHYHIVKYLLEEGEDPNIMCEHGHRPLQVAVIKKNKEIAKLLLDSGAKILTDKEREFIKEIY